MTETDVSETGTTPTTVRAVGAALDLDGRRVLLVEVEPPLAAVKFKADVSARIPRDAPVLLPTVHVDDTRLEVRLPALPPGTAMTISRRGRGVNGPLDLTPAEATAAAAGLRITDGPAGRLTLSSDPAPRPTVGERVYWSIPLALRNSAKVQYRRLRNRISRIMARNDG